MTSIIRNKIKEEQEKSSLSLKDIWIKEFEKVLVSINETYDVLTEESKEDSKIDKMNLFEESLNQPNLHCKWFQYLLKAKKDYRALKANKDKTYLKLWKYYQGKMPASFVKEYGPFNEKVMKSDVEKYLDSDEVWIICKEVVQTQYSVVELCDGMIEAIKQRGFAIKNAIEYRKFETGN